MRNRILAVFVVSLLCALAPLAAAPVLQRGIDVFTTPADGRTYYDFADNPIPAGFFCDGSPAFSGRVAFKGLPLATGSEGQLWGGDTVVERLDDAVFDGRGNAVTRLQFRALSMVSIHPLKTPCGAFHVYVSLARKQEVTTMSIHRTQGSGGHFIAPLAIKARLSFVPVVAPKTGNESKLEITGTFTFPPEVLPWSFAAGSRAIGPAFVDTNGDLTPDAWLPGTTNFAPGVSPGRVVQGSSVVAGCPCPEPSCHAAGGEQHCYTPPLPPGCISCDEL